MKKKAKGFTLVELIIVIAIMGVLLAILIPSWMNYLTHARIKTQNNNAKVIFNAAQTVSQEFKFKERNMLPADRDVGDGDFYFYWDRSTGFTFPSDGTIPGTKQSTGNAKFDADFAERMNKIFSGGGETVYKIWVQNYIVRSVVASRSESDRYLGAYPVILDEVEATHNVMDYPMASIAIP